MKGINRVNTIEQTFIAILSMLAGALLVGVLLLLFSGCSVRPEASPHERAVVELTEDIWRGSGLPEDDDCMGHVGIVVPAAQEFQLRCGQSSFMSVGCVTDRGVGRSSGKVLYVSPDVAKHQIDLVITQLTLKALKECTKDERRGKDWLDPIFVDEAPEENSVEGRIRERLHLIP